jgi:5-methylcytosine-specific restriction endonuclease McrA
VTLRPAPDTMTRLSAELPVATGVAVLKSLHDAADSARASGDPRSRGQVMADTLVERVLGASPVVLPVEIGLVVSAEALFGTSEDSAHLEGHGPLPAELARELAKTAGEAAVARLRRLYRRPTTGELVAMDSRSRRFEGELAHFIRLRDTICRTPWCDAPIRHLDHPRSVAAEGETSADNAQGLCEACNYAKESRGWSARTVATEPHTVETRTPAGQVHRSQAPPLPGHIPRRVADPAA